MYHKVVLIFENSMPCLGIDVTWLHPYLTIRPPLPHHNPPLCLFSLFCVEGEEAQTDQRASMSQMINPIPLSSKRTINNLKPGKTRVSHGTTNLPFFFLRDKRWSKGISHTKKAAATKKKTVVSRQVQIKLVFGVWTTVEYRRWEEGDI